MAEGPDQGTRQGKPAPDGWAAHEEAQHQEWLRSTFRQRLEWLEQAKRFAKAAAAATRVRPAGK